MPGWPVMTQPGVRDYVSVTAGTACRTGPRISRSCWKAGIWIIEGLDLSPVTAGRYEMICLPVKLHGCDGRQPGPSCGPPAGPARAGPPPRRQRSESAGGRRRACGRDHRPGAGAGRGRHLAGSRSGRRDQHQPWAGAGPHLGPGCPAGPGLVLVGRLRPRRPPAGTQPPSRAGQQRPGRPLRPRQEGCGPTCATTASTWPSTSARSGSPARTRCAPRTAAAGRGTAS